MVRTLLHRAENLVTEEEDKRRTRGGQEEDKRRTRGGQEEDKSKEVDHIKKLLKTNGYKTWMVNITQQMRRKENTTTETSRRQYAIGLPYISKLSEQLANIYKSYDIPQTYQHPEAAKCGVLYDIQCPECDQHYIGETAITLGKIIKEHLSCRQPLSAIGEHKLNTGHQCSINDVKILDHEENWQRMKIKEAINIHKEKPTLNRDVGQELPSVLVQLVSHDIGHVIHP